MKYERKFVITVTAEYDTDEPSLPGSIPESENPPPYHQGAGEDLAMLLLHGFDGTKHRILSIDLWENRLTYQAVGSDLYRSERHK